MAINRPTQPHGGRLDAAEEVEEMKEINEFQEREKEVQKRANVRQLNHAQTELSCCFGRGLFRLKEIKLINSALSLLNQKEVELKEELKKEVIEVPGQCQICGERDEEKLFYTVHNIVICRDCRDNDNVVDNYCGCISEVPLITGGTFYASYEPNGSKYAGIPQCGTCKKSNSYGTYGCPRLNAGLQTGQSFVLQSAEFGFVIEAVLW